MDVRVEWKGGLRFEGVGPSGHTVVMDASTESGGQDTGPRPTEMVLFGLGGCTGIDVAILLQKMRQQVSGIALRISAQRADKDPRRFTDIHITYEISGTDLDEAKVQRAVSLSAEKYCSVLHSLNANITTSYEIAEGPGVGGA
ncbi:MAG: OsmC family protein [Bacillota bacterium]|jgi:putative redox protein|nr:OsmC family protein [Bacillota bacterium]HOB90887.1 OsmC family protein [Bacillota bacterium]HPZ54937.1 OsmC family protein [Bacillota bacterium]HQD18020.1 OsmC family protein [Bacillota bacterium]